MAQTSKRSLVQKFLSSTKDYPVLAGVLAGLYPLLFYATNNFTLVNTWGHFFYFTAVFIVIPILLIIAFLAVGKNIKNGDYKKYIIPFLSSFIFLFLMHISYYGMLKKKITAVLLLVAVLVALFLWKHVKKLIVIQGILAIIGFITFIPRIYQALSHDTSWHTISTKLQNITFQKKPNIYFIQPDGMVNFTELYKSPYNYDDKSFEIFLETEGFSLYPNFRSNYASTLTSNSATMMMKHHYYDGGLSLETYNARNAIVSQNNVLNILKNNGYKTHLLTELPYLLLNRPEMGFDYCNISYDDVSFIGTGLGDPVATLEPLKSQLNSERGVPKFFFIEIFNPGHIHGSPSKSEGIEGERQLWLTSLREGISNVKSHISFIKENDPDALIVIMADHGGFVGLGSTSEVYAPIEDPTLIRSVFSSNLAIHWPDSKDYAQGEIKSAVNIFRALFSYLSEDKSLLEETEENNSYLVIKEGAPSGVYKVIDTSGAVTFKKQ